MKLNTLTARLMLVLFMLLFAAWIGWLLWPHLELFTSRSQIDELITSAGIFAPLVYILLQAIQVVIAPVPATVITLTGGFIFDTFWATFYSMVGTTLGFWIVFLISRKFGRRLVKFVVSKERMKRYDKLASEKGMLGFIAFGFLFPFLPDPVVGYIAGLTPMRISSLLILSIITRTPGVLITTFIGSRAGAGEYGVVAIVAVALVIVLSLAHFTRGKIYNYINQVHAWMLRPQTK